MERHELSEPGRLFEELADHFLSTFGIPQDRSLVRALGHPDQISNRTALVLWSHEQLADPTQEFHIDPFEFLSGRLAVVLARQYPHRLSEILGQILGKDILPDFEVLAALRGIASNECGRLKHSQTSGLINQHKENSHEKQK